MSGSKTTEHTRRGVTAFESAPSGSILEINKQQLEQLRQFAAHRYKKQQV